MLDSWVFLLLLVPGGWMFMIHNTEYGLCLEDSANAGQVLLEGCDLDSQAQQWLWINQDMLMCVGSSKCLSSQQDYPVQTQDCPESDQEAPELMWDCSSNRLISRNTSFVLSTDGQSVNLTDRRYHFEWKSLDKGDVCQTSLRLRRASDQDEFEKPEEAKEREKRKEEEEREYYRWLYRTEDPKIWTFVLLVLAFVCLLIGFLLLGMGAMANKSRKKIAKYKAQASLVKKHEGEGFQVISAFRDNGTSPLPQGHTSSMSEGDAKELKAGDIVVTWKDGNTSCLYSDHVVEERQEELEKEQQEKQEKVWQEREAHDEGRKTE